MKFEKKYFKDAFIGLTYQTDRYLFFYGGKNFQPEIFHQVFPEFQFLEVHQIHSDICVYASDEKVKADAHWTDAINSALLIKTADCMPLLLAQDQRILAIHSGWRGTLSRILNKSAEISLNPNQSVLLSCGPSIQQSSFEVDLELAKKFAQEYPEQSEIYKRSETNSDKAYLDLSRILAAQMKELIIEDCYISAIDTMTDSDYFSYRRDKPDHGRNYSFVVRHK